MRGDSEWASERTCTDGDTIKAEIEEKDKFECTKKMDFLCIGPSTIVVASTGESKYNSPS